MQYTSTITKSGQITLPKPLRDLLGVKHGERVTFNTDQDSITIKREKTINEIIAEIDAINAQLPQKTKDLIKQNAGKTVHEIMDEYWDSPEGQQELHRINYGN